jgi:LemA protein
MLILLGVLVAIGLYGVVTYNRFVSLSARTKEAWADIDVQLKRRYDLIPNLVETVKGYAVHESGVLEAVIKARAEATSTHIDVGSMTAAQMTAMSGAEASLTGALGKLMAISEAYPDLKANSNFAQLSSELSDTENKIQAARRFYNGNVRDLSIALQTFPSNIIASMFGFSGQNYFELPEQSVEREPVKVSF